MQRGKLLKALLAQTGAAAEASTLMKLPPLWPERAQYALETIRENLEKIIRVFADINGLKKSSNVLQIPAH